MPLSPPVSNSHRSDDADVRESTAAPHRSDAYIKITAIETLVCHARMRNWVFVRVVTDEPGLYLPGRFGVRIENTLVVTPYKETEFGKFLVSQYKLEKGMKVPTSAGIFRFRDEFYLYYHGYGVFHNRALCGDTKRLESWEQTALYCYIIMRMIV